MKLSPSLTLLASGSLPDLEEVSVEVAGQIEFRVVFDDITKELTPEDSGKAPPDTSDPDAPVNAAEEEPNGDENLTLIVDEAGQRTEAATPVAIQLEAVAGVAPIKSEPTTGAVSSELDERFIAAPPLFARPPENREMVTTSVLEGQKKAELVTHVEPEPKSTPETSKRQGDKSSQTGQSDLRLTLEEAIHPLKASAGVMISPKIDDSPPAAKSDNLSIQLVAHQASLTSWLDQSELKRSWGVNQNDHTQSPPLQGQSKQVSHLVSSETASEPAEDVGRRGVVDPIPTGAGSIARASMENLETVLRHEASPSERNLTAFKVELEPKPSSQDLAFEDDRLLSQQSGGEVKTTLPSSEVLAETSPDRKAVPLEETALSVTIKDGGSVPERLPTNLSPAAASKLNAAIQHLSPQAENTFQTADRIEISMSPKELGRVSLCVTRAEHGVVLLVQAERPETLDLMRRHLPDLMADLKEMGFSDVSYSDQHHRKDPQRGDLTQVLQGEHVEEGDPVMHETVTSGLDLRL